MLPTAVLTQRRQETDGFDTSGPWPQAIRSPSPSENLSRHPFFRDEFALPTDDAFESLVAARRVCATASIPSSTPAPSPRQASKTRKSKAPKRNKNKADMAGLVGGDSDSSALTQESGDEAAFTPRESVVTGTDAGTDYEDDAETQEVPSGVLGARCLRMIMTAFQHRSHQKLAAVVGCRNQGEEQREEAEVQQAWVAGQARRERSRRPLCLVISGVTCFPLSDHLDYLHSRYSEH